jgi:uncharacterized protein
LLPEWFYKEIWRMTKEQRRAVRENPEAHQVPASVAGSSVEERFKDPEKVAPDAGLVPWKRLVNAILLEGASVTAKHSKLYGVAHWERVASVGLELAEEAEGADAHVIKLFAALHDARRFSDEQDPEHGPRGAALARKLRGKLFVVSDEQLKTLTRAIAEHSRGHTSSDPTIGCCWDADRLDLPRCGIRPDPDLLSTEAAKKRLQEQDKKPKGERATD